MVNVSHIGTGVSTCLWAQDLNLVEGEGEGGKAVNREGELTARKDGDEQSVIFLKRPYIRMSMKKNQPSLVTTLIPFGLSYSKLRPTAVPEAHGSEWNVVEQP
ncbi:hypothetical protein WG66_016856 [Moniliophthora roreri]|uniref:Uncharacterized protein n=1 Tax=Moniliophthora roreri TaxID=221103 RepID=A0A0W0G1D7_MONRR|nr:hypothetical protein WG66_016856 [Moniliophthora roreri]